MGDELLTALKQAISSMPEKPVFDRLIVTYQGECFRKRSWVPNFIWKRLAIRFQPDPKMYALGSPPLYWLGESKEAKHE